MKSHVLLCHISDFQGEEKNVQLEEIIKECLGSESVKRQRVPFVYHEGCLFCTSFLTKRFWRLRKKLEEGNKSGETEKLSVLDEERYLWGDVNCLKITTKTMDFWVFTEFNCRILTRIPHILTRSTPPKRIKTWFLDGASKNRSCRWCYLESWHGNAWFLVGFHDLIWIGKMRRKNASKSWSKSWWMLQSQLLELQSPRKIAV